MNQSDQYGTTPLHIACAEGHERIVKILLKNGRGVIDVNQREKNGETPLWIACSQGREQIVKILLSSGKDIDVKKKAIVYFYGRKFTAAEIARKNGCPKIADLVDEYEGKPEEVRLRLGKGKDSIPFLFLLFFIPS